MRLWNSGLSKYKVAEIYRNQYNESIYFIRLDKHNRYEAKRMTKKEALAKVERVIYEEMMKKRKKRNNVRIE